MTFSVEAAMGLGIRGGIGDPVDSYFTHCGTLFGLRIDWDPSNAKVSLDDPFYLTFDVFGATNSSDKYAYITVSDIASLIKVNPSHEYSVQIGKRFVLFRDFFKELSWGPLPFYEFEIGYMWYQLTPTDSWMNYGLSLNLLDIGFSWTIEQRWFANVKYTLAGLNLASLTTGVDYAF